MTEEPEIGNKRLGVLIQRGGGGRNMLGVAGREGGSRGRGYVCYIYMLKYIYTHS